MILNGLRAHSRYPDAPRRAAAERAGHSLALLDGVVVWIDPGPIFRAWHMQPLAANTAIKQYRILAPIGKGGMGEVYLAQDTALGRKVALKILPSEFADDRDRMDRFVREAKSASALNHPNIITIHEIGESNGTHFIATEFIDGKTLTELARSQALDYRFILDVAIQVVSALDDAHSAGIVHRDIKPDNVMVRSNGLAKLLDFGIAKLSAPTDSSDDTTIAIPSQTHAGVLIGTPQFMSPEQARGLRVDHQTDIFSFGVVMHHMLSGQSPFAGDTVSDVLAAVLTREPRRLTEVPAGLADIVSKTLQKDTRHRYRSARDLLRDLRAFRQASDFQDSLDRRSESTGIEATPGRSGSRHSIAVLPFTNMSADADNEYFCDGLAEELLNALSKIDDLKVAARTSAFSFKGKNVNVSEIGARLSVNHILEGSVRRSGNRLRISVQLVNASDGFHLWSDRYDSEMRDIFDVQDEIALAVVGALKVTLFGAEKAALLKRYTDDAAVHELFLKGRYYSYKYSAEGWTRAIEFFQRAIDMQPDYAPAYAGMAACYGCLWFFGLLPAGANRSAKQSGHAQGPGNRRDPRGRLPLVGDDHVLLRLGVGERRAGLQTIDSPEFEQRRSALILRLVSRLRRTCRRSARPGSARARNRSALAAHQHERRLDVLLDRSFRRSVGPGREDDRDRA